MQSIEALEQMFPEFSDFVRDKPNVLRWGIGYAETEGVPEGTLAFIITVSRKEHDQGIPQQFKGVPVRVVEGEPTKPGSNGGVFSPAPGGVEVRNQRLPNSTGTLGCYLVCEAYFDLFLLSNNHVIAGENAGMAGDAITQGGNSIATLFRFPLLMNGSPIDCAVARMNRPGPDRATSPDALIGILDAFGEHIDVSAEIGTIGALTAGSALAAGRLDPSGSASPDLVLLYVDAPAGQNQIYLTVGRRFGASGRVQAGWTQPKPIQSIGNETQALGAAIADINGDGKPDLILFWVDNPTGPNHALYQIGYGIDQDGNIERWGPRIQIPGWWGSETAGGGIAICHLEDPNRLDLVVLFVDNASGANMAYVRVGTGLDSSGTASWTRPPEQLGGWWGNETQGADIAFLGAEVNGASFLVAQIDNPSGENFVLYRKVKLSAAGGVIAVDAPRTVGGWVGAESAGLGCVVIGERNPRQLAMATIDNPSGGNSVTLRVANELNPAQLGRWWAKPSTNLKVPQLGASTWKSGSRTELWAGGRISQVKVVNVTPYSPPAGKVELVDLFQIEPRISDKGDSGSIVFDERGYPIGLVVGGTMRDTLACRIDNVLGSLQASSPYPVPEIVSDQTRGVGVAAIPWTVPTPRTDLIVANADDGGRIYYRVARDLDSNGQPRQGWTNPTAVVNTPSVRGTREIGLAQAQFLGAAGPALVLLEVGLDQGITSATLRIAQGFDQQGQVTQPWSMNIPIPWVGADCQGADVAVGNIGSFTGIDIALLTIFRDGNQNVAKYRVGLDFTAKGTANWKDWVTIPGWFGTRTQGAGIAIVDLDGDDRGDLVVFFIDDASGENVGYYRVGKSLPNGHFDWSLPPQAIPHWWGHESQGGGLTVADVTGNGRPDLIAAHADNPPGYNHLYYRVVFDIMPSGLPAIWKIA